MFRYASPPLVCLTLLVGLLSTSGCRTAAPTPEAPAGPAVYADPVSANSALGLDLYSHIGRPDQNLVYSPFSISTALGMLYAGARGETGEGIAVAMRSEGGAQIHGQNGDLVGRLEVEGKEETDPTLLVANSIWAQMNMAIGVDFLQVVEQAYRSEVRMADFQSEPEEARELINAWVDERTRNLIPELIGKGLIDSMTRLVLVNALYFKGSWQFPFAKAEPGDFHAPKGRTIEAQMMRQRAELGHAVSADYEIVELPYENSTVTMLVVMPKRETPRDFIEELSPARIGELAGSLEVGKVDLRFPKFEMRSPIPLNEPLKRMGMEIAFTEQADFAPITRDMPLKVSAVVHEATITVDEKGTEAAAATAVMARTISMPKPEKIVGISIDRPFAFFIRDKDTGVVLFIGQVYEP